MTRIAPLDIIEMQTGNGLAYASVTHVHPSYPPVVRLAPSLCKTRPADPAGLLQGGDCEILLMPLETVLSQLDLDWQKVGALPDEAGNSPFPTFRTPIRDRAGAVIYWWYWDGEGLRFDEGSETDLASAAADLPLREVTGAAGFAALLHGLGDAP
ncbi:hypothetical protein BV394_06795 [Brevirhabdus pacifica]|uniref:Uncharacterized protein n=1 Tax=Brevirhabdus pacifica TaxID=1267768 RepID=A0A1U7DHV9_9RHOB|nr:hypothetical protein [Brevirhabdus pacifica]APX89458.1 hypothetical protein BV394_06795 [Brevirhabdus pacifica]OWU76528.1 hypothetical protein ATO5_09500 [Loktanella sp. 22II-4b]PJJ85895.1 hypothetical protein CLV77_0427 [Brevirhabdus pacifica]